MASFIIKSDDAIVAAELQSDAYGATPQRRTGSRHRPATTE